MDKEAREWRQIYKALQLLEYIIKHGSERDVDDARAHMSTLKMLRSFHYVDEKGKDQGVNVRQRSKEIVELLTDLERVRQERRKAKANRSKYVGTGNDPMSFSSSGGRYGGFGSDTLDYGGGSGYGGSSGYGESSGGHSSGFRDSSRRQNFEEYDAGEWEDTPRRSTTTSQPAGSSHTTTATTQPAAKPEPKAPAPPKVQNLLDFDDDAWGSSTSVPAPTPAAPVPSARNLAVSNDFDDFDDFQSAPSATTTAPVPAPSPMAATAPASKPAANVFDLLNATPAAPASATAAGRPSMGYGMGGGTMPSRTPTFAPMKPATPASPVPAASAKATNGGGFDDLWTMSLGGSKPSTPAAGSNTGKTIQDLQREKASQVFWGAGTSTHRPGSASIGGGQSAASSGADDLLL